MEQSSQMVNLILIGNIYILLSQQVTKKMFIIIQDILMETKYLVFLFHLTENLPLTGKEQKNKNSTQHTFYAIARLGLYLMTVVNIFFVFIQVFLLKFSVYLLTLVLELRNSRKAWER